MHNDRDDDSDSGESTSQEHSLEGEISRVAQAVFLLAMSLLAFELVTTRIFSVIMWNHFAFLAISIGLFGFGVAGVVVYVAPGFFSRSRAYGQLRVCALLLPLAIAFSVIVLCALPIRMDFSTAINLQLGIVFLVTAVPFAIGGAGITLALAHWPSGIRG